MPTLVDLTGQIFGLWTVLAYTSKSKWLCVCACGTEKLVFAQALTAGKSSSCGCVKKESLIGQEFGKLKVLSAGIPSSNSEGRLLWRCVCLCGREITTTGKNLRSGNTKSCGICYREGEDLTGRTFGRWLAFKRVTYKNRTTYLCKCLCGVERLVDSDSLASGKSLSCGCYAPELWSVAGRKRKGIPNLKIRGENNPNWKGGMKYRSLKDALRQCPKYQFWRLQVYQRDWYKCTECGAKPTKGSTIHAHHIVYFSTLLIENSITSLEQAQACAALWDINNGVTLCEGCHRRKHWGGEKN